MALAFHASRERASTPAPTPADAEPEAPADSFDWEGWRRKVLDDIRPAASLRPATRSAPHASEGAGPPHGPRPASAALTPATSPSTVPPPVDATGRCDQAVERVQRAKELAARQLGKLLGTPAEDLDRIAEQADLYFATVASYVEATGAELMLVVRHPRLGAIRLSPKVVFGPCRAPAAG